MKATQKPVAGDCGKVGRRKVGETKKRRSPYFVFYALVQCATQEIDYSGKCEKEEMSWRGQAWGSPNDRTTRVLLSGVLASATHNTHGTNTAVGFEVEKVLW